MLHWIRPGFEAWSCFFCTRISRLHHPPSHTIHLSKLTLAPRFTLPRTQSRTSTHKPERLCNDNPHSRRSLAAYTRRHNLSLRGERHRAGFCYTAKQIAPFPPSVACALLLMLIQSWTLTQDLQKTVFSYLDNTVTMSSLQDRVQQQVGQLDREVCHTIRRLHNSTGH